MTAGAANGTGGHSPHSPLRRVGFDELTATVRQAALARGYPKEIASIAAEMTLWCERHRLPALAAMADHFERIGRFEASTAEPKPQKDGSIQFNDPLLGGMFIHHHYDDFQWPALIDGPKTGTVLFAAFLALGAHQRGDHLSIAFLGAEDRPAEAARLLYGEGRSLVEGDASVIRFSRRIAIEKVEPSNSLLLEEALSESIPCDPAVMERLSTDVSKD
ncbi:DUF3726 domain-containing protein [Notoacmeibacter ruber]|uniref:DUF3726 domain-containing protein n=1 Tax=Notoacmeibacter ruber TaxID=2670375 RepID=A0A3L7JE59_9HYPH|nr:DUF3726 domain-containing protein [Notoacmeibacter ruber]RLQ89057.1 DUF3726 domain-containing protein [Notoacmeibacter ruber]